MGRITWAAAVAAGALVATGLALGRPHRIAASPPSAPTKSESEIRSLDIEFYERRIAEDSFSAADRSRLASLYLQRARETGSYPDYERAGQLARASLALREGHNAETYVLLTSALLAKHEFTDALRVARRVYATDATDASHTALLAEVELEVGDYASASRHFGSVSADADKPSIAARLARWYEITGRLETARSLLRRSTERMAKSSDVPHEQLAWFHYRLGELYLRDGRLSAADSAFHRALAALPTDYRALSGLARMSAARGDWNAAVEFGARAIAVQLDPATLGTMSDAYAALGDTAQARSFADAMAVAALSQPGAIHRAWGLFLLDHDRDVARVLREARKDIVRRRDVYGYDLLAWASYKAGRINEARKASAAALAQATEDATLLYHAGMIAAAAGDSAAAKSFLGRALVLNPTFSPTQAKLARRTFDALSERARNAGPTVASRGGAGV
jgi:tetratricopeptide (TPR) repeat protein